jgi:hypothetical protein
MLAGASRSWECAVVIVVNNRTGKLRTISIVAKSQFSSAVDERDGDTQERITA